MTRIYNITMSTPFGIQKGRITLVITGNSLSGVLEGMGAKSEFYNGKISGNNFEFSGQARSLIARIQYHVKGTLSNEVISASINTNHGTFSASGTLVSQS
ncbi:MULTISPECIES: hypothetical protein [unclassified Clostridium]|uniref:hypothetical protein n=1 Tax=unclassified Clostridium TaxID=2614128 RepID=UPI000297EB76|nr:MULTISPECIES: hypothetical protein [unclassified Clostridium]EKQ56789.1 MAG: hypothetical protein A370_01564 [Clostridium sp. Maddingley MBC34-26]